LAYLPSGSILNSVDGAVFLPEYRPAHEDHVVQLLELMVPSTLKSGRAPGGSGP
jgi:hypothetical protein